MATDTTPDVGSTWRNNDTGEIVTVESFDGGYAVVYGEYEGFGRGTTIRTARRDLTPPRCSSGHIAMDRQSLAYPFLLSTA
jgi:hypothetical protein